MSHALPIFQTSNFSYPDAAAADSAASGGAYLYSRHGNPTNEAFEQAIANLEGAEAGLSFASGQAAVATAIFALARADSDGPGGGAAIGEVLASDGIYGGSTELVRDLLPAHGSAARFVAGWDTDAVAAAVGSATRALLVETISNPLLRLADLPALGAMARNRGFALIVDSTFATPCLCRPLEHGATAVVHSVSKYIGGHGDLLGGIVVGSAATIARVRRYRTLFGGIMDPFCAWLAARGTRTLALRVERQCATAARLADVMATLPGVQRVHYPTRADHPDQMRARALLAAGAGGAIVSFDLGGGAAARRFYDRVRLIVRAASLGEVTSLLTHPASFSHKGLSPDERARHGISDGLLRLSVGIEAPEDLEDDIRQALAH